MLQTESVDGVSRGNENILVSVNVEGFGSACRADVGVPERFTGSRIMSDKISARIGSEQQVSRRGEQPRQTSLCAAYAWVPDLPSWFSGLVVERQQVSAE